MTDKILRITMIESWITIVFTLLSGFCMTIYAQDAATVFLDEVVVTAGRTPVTFDQLNRSVEVITREDISNSPAGSVLELLQNAVSIDIQTRGVSGIQADLSIRGTSFEQSLVMIDGIKISDPQTGHHTLNIPLTKDDVERIEILRGQGSRAFGQNAMGGVINIITRGVEAMSASIKTTGGDFGLFDGSVSLSLPMGNTFQRVSISHSQSSGYKADSDFNQWIGSYNLTFPIGNEKLRLKAAYQEKKFGASNFYTDWYPNEWEHTRATFFSAQTDIAIRKAIISPTLFWRKHTDRFLLKRDDPAFYDNNHSTDNYGMELQLARDLKWGSGVIGGEISQEKIHGNSLGDHRRDKANIFAERLLKYENRFSITIGGCGYKYGDLDWNFEPGVDLGFRVRPGLRFYGNVGGAFRVPTFTELYTASSANKGNPDLEPERAWTTELGSTIHSDPFHINMSVFRRQGENLIDWVRNNPENPWQAENITNLNTNGLELDIRYYPQRHFAGLPVYLIQIGTTWLKSDAGAPSYQSKYALNYLNRQLQTSIEHGLPFGFHQTWNLSNRDRKNGDEFTLLDSKISGQIQTIGISFTVSNILDEEYYEIGLVEMPGRWFKMGVEYKIGDR
ncbi:MAG: TonB-dependent receptor [Calditrichaeota bacterium]|nr:TonB-dependent receptor [Calditrichota bacterium]